MNKFPVFAPQAIELNEFSSLIENRRVYTLNNCEVNIYETYQAAQNVSIKFNDLVITSMMRGKKIMHAPDNTLFEYKPGESLVWQANKPMVIDFPEAAEDNPTQCMALTISNDEIQETLHFLNRNYPKLEENGGWQINMEQFYLLNSEDLATSINKMINVSIGESHMKDAFAQLALRELLLKLMQTQARKLVQAHYTQMASYNRFAAVIKYVQENIHQKISVDELCKKAYMSRPTFFRIFKREFGITPVEYIIKEKMKFAKDMLINSDDTITTVSYRCGFNNVNHFIKTFRYLEKSTPLQFKKLYAVQNFVQLSQDILYPSD
jgi:AraC-like DNA-binding protein